MDSGIVNLLALALIDLQLVDDEIRIGGRIVSVAGVPSALPTCKRLNESEKFLSEIEGREVEKKREEREITFSRVSRFLASH